MTEATPLASEQITRKALLQIQHSVAQAQIPGNDWRRELSLIANTCEEALSASPAPSGQGVSGDEMRARVIAAMNPHGWLGDQCVTDIVAALAAPAPSCAPGEVERKWRPFIHQRDVPTDGTWFVARSIKPGWQAVRVVHYASKSDRLPTDGTGWVWPSEPTEWLPVNEFATPSQGLDAKEGGEANG